MIILSNQKDDFAYWMCRECIGTGSFEECNIGHIGEAQCAVCGKWLSRPAIAYVVKAYYEKAKQLQVAKQVMLEDKSTLERLAE
jgi:hypothetical protein